MPKPKPDETTDTVSPTLPVSVPEGDLVPVTITKFGDGKVSTGERDEVGDIYAKRGDVLLVSQHVADSLEKRALAETA